MKTIATMIVAALLLVPAANADISAKLLNANNLSNSSTVNAGSFFDVFIQLDITGSLLASWQAQLQADATASDIFTLQSATFLPGAGPEWSSDPLDQVFTPSETLNAANSLTSSAIGNIAADLNAGVGDGSYQVVKLRILTSSLSAPGDYKLSLIGLSFSDTGYNDVAGTTPGAYDVHITSAPVPAPGAVLLVMIGTGLVSSLRRRLA